MNILYYSWGENSQFDMLQALSASGHTVSRIFFPTTEYLSQPELEQTIAESAIASHCDLIFTFNYIPFVAQTAERIKTRYVSWVYDCPHYPLFSPTIASEYNYIFLFDKSMAELALHLGARHAYHLPLAANPDRLRNLSGNASCFSNKITFVGSLYENNHFNLIHYLPEDLRGYLDGIMAAQGQIWGQDLLSDLMTPDLVGQLHTYIQYDKNPLCPIPEKYFFLNMLSTKLTSEERISYLNALAEKYQVTLYTASDVSRCPKALCGGTVSYATEMPLVFANSDINLNITLRSIHSGIPLRALDIMSCGGFLLTNYQPELEQYFKNGTDYVYFEGKEDMISKTDYYLSHPKERTEIAQNGLRKVSSDFSYIHQIQTMFSYL